MGTVIRPASELSWLSLGGRQPQDPDGAVQPPAGLQQVQKHPQLLRCHVPADFQPSPFQSHRQLLLPKRYVGQEKSLIGILRAGLNSQSKPADPAAYR